VNKLINKFMNKKLLFIVFTLLCIVFIYSGISQALDCECGSHMETQEKCTFWFIICWEYEDVKVEVCNDCPAPPPPSSSNTYKSKICNEEKKCVTETFSYERQNTCEENSECIDQSGNFTYACCNNDDKCVTCESNYDRSGDCDGDDHCEIESWDSICNEEWVPGADGGLGYTVWTCNFLPSDPAAFGENRRECEDPSDCMDDDDDDDDNNNNNNDDDDNDEDISQCLVNKFNMPNHVWVGYHALAEWSTNEDCNSADISCKLEDGSDCGDKETLAGPVSVGFKQSQKFKILEPGIYRYELEACGSSNCGTWEDDLGTGLGYIEIQAVNLPWWQEIIPVLPDDLQGFLRGLFG
jgi:hypothetical protein